MGGPLGTKAALQRKRTKIEDLNLLTSDNELLVLYIENNDERAFETLIRRHAPMVMGVCRSMLWKTEDAEDAFQAVFLLLSQKAKKLLSHNSVGGWIHETSYRTCLKLRRKIARVREVDMKLDPAEHIEPWQRISMARETELLHKEIMRLPKKYREVVVLCHLEGKSRAQAASMLDRTTASVKASLARGRKLLRQRLLKHGIAASVVLLGVTSETFAAASSSAGIGNPGVTESLIQSTVQACQEVQPAISLHSSIHQFQSLFAGEKAMNFGITNALLLATIAIVMIAAMATLTNAESASSNVKQTVLFQPSGGVSDQSDPKINYAVNQELESESVGQRDSEFDPSKRADETWQQYVDRLADHKVIQEDQRQQWENGNRLQVLKELTLSRSRMETRKRQVPVTRMRVEKQPDGTEIDVPYIQQVEQSYTVMTPFEEKINGSLNIPAPGTKPENATNRGFLDSMGKPLNIEPGDDVLNCRICVATGNSHPKLKIANKALGHALPSRRETWKQYVERLFDYGLIDDRQFVTWAKGESLEFEKEVDILVDKNVAVPGPTTNLPENRRLKFKFWIPPLGSPMNGARVFGVKQVGSELDKKTWEFDHEVIEFETDGKLPLLQQLQSIESSSSKKENESWHDYMDRLYHSGLITRTERKYWLMGQEIQIEKNFMSTVVSMQHREIGSGSKKRTVLVGIPSRKEIVGTLTIPELGTASDDFEARGYKFNYYEALRPKETKPQG